jgi:hypothetical protein
MFVVFFFDDTLTFRLKSCQVTIHSFLTIQWYAGRCGRDRIVVGFTTTVPV